MRVLVCGGRDFQDKSLYAVLDKLHRESSIGVIIEGAARGADRMAGYWARKNKIDNLKFHADWQRLGIAAGPRRNQQMIEQGRPDLVVAFPGGVGTADMVRRARAAKIEVIEIPRSSACRLSPRIEDD